MNNRYKRVLAAVLSIVMLMTVTLSVSVFAEGTGVKVNATIKMGDSGNASYLMAVITLDEELATVNNDELTAVYGKYLRVNGALLEQAHPYNGGAGNSVFLMVGDNAKELKLYTDNCSWVANIIGDSAATRAVGLHGWQENTVELLKGFPLADGKELADDVVFNAAKDSGLSWTVTGDGLKPAPKTATKLSATIKMGDSGNASYLMAVITLDEELATVNDDELTAVYGKYLRVNGALLEQAHPYNGGAGNSVFLMVGDNAKELKLYTDNCSWVANITGDNTATRAVGLHGWQENTVELLKGFPLAGDKELADDIVFNAAKDSGLNWTVSGDGLKPSTEPDPDPEPEPKPDDRPAATTDDLVTGVARDQSGSYGVADLFFGKVLKSGDVSANYGDYVKVNGVLLKTGMAYNNPQFSIPAIKAFANDNVLQIQTSNCDMASAIDPSLPSDRVVFFSENQDNTIELLAGFPFADGTVLDRNITLTMAKHKSGERGVWTVSDAGGSLKPDFDAKDWSAVDPGDVDNTFDRDAVQDPNAGQKLTMEMLPITVTVDGKEYTTPFLPANLGGYFMENGGYYSGVRIKFNRPLMYKDGETLLKLMGDKMKIGAKAVDAALSESSRNMDGNGDFVKATLSDDKCELLLLYRWDKISGPWLYTQDGTVNPTEDKSKWQTNGGQADCSITLLEGIAYGKGDEVTDYTLRAAFSGETWSWTVENSGDEPDMTGEKVTVFITDADGVPGITDPVAGQSWQSQVKIVFSHKLYTDDVSEAALIAKYGKYITLNSTTVADLYELNNPGTGVPHAVTLELVDGGKALLVKCDVTMVNNGALVSTSDQLILLDKDFPITSKKTLEEEWAFEYTVESGDWVRLTDDPDQPVDPVDPVDPGKDDPSSPDTPKTGVAGVSAAVLVLTAICGVTVMVTRRKNNA